VGPYIGFFFSGFSFLGIIFIYFCYPETKGASIEELDLWFQEKLPTSQFGKIKRGQHAIQEYAIEGHDPVKDVESGDDTKDAVNVNVTSEKSE
jgi:SP family sugar:H+ symporter-like MFS transporter